jgi:hypothetical protein
MQSPRLKGVHRERTDQFRKETDGTYEQQRAYARAKLQASQESHAKQIETERQAFLAKENQLKKITSEIVDKERKEGEAKVTTTQKAYRDQTEKERAQGITNIEETRKAYADEVARQRAMRQEARDRRELLSSGLGGAAATMAGIVAATTAAAAAIAGIVTAVGDLILRLSSAVLEMIAFREASIATLGLMSEGRTAQERQAIGREEFAWARQFARETPLDVRDVIGLRTPARYLSFACCASSTWSRSEWM